MCPRWNKITDKRTGKSGQRRREKRVKRWFGVERGEGFFDRITVIGVEFILRQCFGVVFCRGRIICVD